MPLPAHDSSFKFLPDIASKVPQRAAQLNLTVSGYVAILLWNYAQAPFDLGPEAASEEFARQRVGGYLRRAIAGLAMKHARSAGMSINSFVEALVARDLRSSDGTLTILPARGSSKPTIKPSHP